MANKVAIGIQDYKKIIENGYFYVDKTSFIRQWWENGDEVTLITRPRRFGKTLTISMVEQFFSVHYAHRSDLFENLFIWHDEVYHALQGTYPVISLSFANIKEKTYTQTTQRIGQLITELYSKNRFLLDSGILDENERQYYESIRPDMPEVVATLSIYNMSNYLSRYYKKKTIILLDEYDTPMQEAYLNGYWDELTAYTCSLFNAAFKTNPYMERALMTGITRISKESMFSGLNNLKVVTTTSEKYADCFGFTEQEVFAAMDEFGRANEKDLVKEWYDGFTFGKISDIYNPWSIINYLDEGKINTYWANTSGNSLAGELIRKGSSSIKQSFEILLKGGHLTTQIDEQIVFDQLNGNAKAVWSLLLASGYLKVVHYSGYSDNPEAANPLYELALTNREVRIMFQNMVAGWFSETEGDYNDFIKALLAGDIKTMNAYMNRVALTTFSYFDTGKKSSGISEPERFYHGFVLGLIVELNGRYTVTSNRESGFGRYDVLLEPLKAEKDDGIILEFKVREPLEEASLQDTVKKALAQIESKNYEQVLIDKGLPHERIRKYGFAFEGKTVLIG